MIVSIAGLAVIEILFYAGAIEGEIWRIVEIGFEAATVGGIADWFAVSALFREIPIPVPFIKKHTNIIVNNRKKLTDGASDLVTSKWLSKESLKEKISGFDFSGFILENLNDPNSRYKENITDLIRDIALRFVSVIDRPDIIEFMKKIFADQIKDLDLAKPLGNWIKRSFDEGKHEQIWEMLIRNTRKVINSETTRKLLDQEIDKLVQNYKDQGVVKKMFVSIAEKFKGIDREIIAEQLINVINEFLKEAENNPGHKFRKDLDKVVLDFADGLINSDPSSVKIISDLKENILNNPDVDKLLHNALTNLKKTISVQLENTETPLMKTIIENLDRIIEEINVNKDSQLKINNWIKDNLSEMIDKHHYKIGEHVIDSMNKLDDKELVEQIEEKVGDDLQFIRLNGAIVGGLAGILIGLLKVMIFS